MATFLLIRHASHELLGKRFVARTPGVHLGEQGRRESEALAARLDGLDFAGLFSSPMERARETAEPLAKRLGLAVEIREELNEIDIGAWTDMSMEDLLREPGWKEWHEARSCNRPPGGERMVEVQARMAAAIDELRVRDDRGLYALFSHADPIKALVTLYLGMPIDLFNRLQIEPASVTTLTIDPWGPRLIGLNDLGRTQVGQ